MQESFSEVSTTSWFGRLWDSIKGVMVGLLLLVVSFPLLFWNEGRAVRRAQDLEAGRDAVVEAQAAAVDAAQEGRLVHLTGVAATTATVRDAELGPSAPGALRLRRVAEMYQWSEESRTSTSSNTGGSQTRRTTYTYRTEWSSAPVDSSRFRQPDGHFNPPMPVRGTTFDAQPVTVGARTLSPDLVAQIEGWRPIDVAPEAVPTLANWRRSVRRAGEWLYLGDNPNAPEVGDTRVRWEVAPSGPVSVLAAQRGASFGDWTSPTGRTLEANLEMGTVSAAGMFSTLETHNVMLTWGLRFVGWLLMFIGFAMILHPLVVVADVLPLLGSLVGAGAGLAAFALASPLSLLTVAVAWIVYRPVLGAGLLAAGVGVAVLVGRGVAARGASKNAQRAAQRNPPPAQAWGAPPGPPQPAWQQPQGWGPPRP